ncbi:MAG: beta-agarase [Armatimonadetes bacterium]|nr:beta-agarase [Armatimonadota bacterium]MDW8123051.1 beta-agarase [Armatimonadota bacterium]
MEARGLFRLEERGGIWWFVDPQGHLFLSKGVNHCSFIGDGNPKTGRRPYHESVRARYGSEEAWAEATVQRLKEWGFNTVGGWSSPSLFSMMPYTIIVNWFLMEDLGADEWLRGDFPDVFSSDYEERVEKAVAAHCLPRKDDPLLVGYFTDNELHWGPDWRSPDHLLDRYLFQFPQGSPGHQEAIAFLKQRGRDGERIRDEGKERADENLTLEDRQAFLGVVARRYFSLWHKAIRAVDPHHLILGCRFAGLRAPEVILMEMIPFVDAVSVQWYGWSENFPIAALQKIHEITGKPVILSEFSFIAEDSGQPNKKRAVEPVPTQKDRASHYRTLVKTLMSLPFAVGFHWFEWADDPPDGDYFGEDCNYGLVTTSDEPYQDLIEEVKAVNQWVDRWHQERTSECRQ